MGLSFECLFSKDTVTLSPMLKVGYPFPAACFNARVQLFSICSFFRDEDMVDRSSILLLMLSAKEGLSAGGVEECECE